MDSNMPLIQLTQLELLGDNPTLFTNTLDWRVQIECLDELKHPITVTFVWVGSAASSEYDQVLDSFDVGPFPVGANVFDLSVEAPNPDMLPPSEVIGVTVLQINLSYNDETFLTVGYLVSSAYFDEALNQRPPAQIDLKLLGRSIRVVNPTVTAFPVSWDGVTVEEED